MSDNVLLSYQRRGLTYTGQLDGQGFNGLTFAEMMTATHRILAARPEVGLTLQRTERAGLLPIVLERDVLELLRHDPVAYIRAHTLPPRTIDLSGEKRTSKLAAPYAMPGGLRAGVGTLAAAFGEQVYLKISNYRVEHPQNGRWVQYAELKRWLGTDDIDGIFSVDGVEGAGWFLVKVTDLLATKAGRFFLPREWNEHGSWITAGQLQGKYDQFIKERELCLSAMNQTT